MICLPRQMRDIIEDIENARTIERVFGLFHSLFRMMKNLGAGSIPRFPYS